MKHLFVCTGGITRSQEAVLVATKLADHYEFKDYEADYFGIDSGQKPDSEVFTKYDLIICMEESHKVDLMKKYAVPEEKIRVLDIPDEHSRSESKLKEILDKVLFEKLEPIFHTFYTVI